MISAVKSAISRRRTPKQRGAERDGTPARLWPEILIGPGAASPSATPPFTPVDYYADRLIARLADSRPSASARVLRVLLETYPPSYDFEDRLKG